LADDRRLGARARAVIADPANEILVSTVSLWEIVVKMRIGKLHADIGDIAAAIGRQGFIILDISLDHLIALADLPSHHRDPFDHLLMAQAMTRNAVFVTDSHNAAQYPVQVIACV
jgi:PIN domain nuclease of toxin-antitoxin system